ncbi:MAG TPA: helix-turn-helix transcriptional regulator [Ohtaekwangia sp.]|uniref:helix-turn-helix domain-containing protein n=1 Tax=Ohtaekwangia sp. TaxID=2066019 RepID=UPI002F9209CA
MTDKLHLGRKVARLRELRGMKQETLAEELGISQQAVSKLEQSEQIEDTTLTRIAKALGLTPEAIKNFSEESIIYNIQNNNYDSASAPTANQSNHYNNCNFNPLDEYINEVKENKKLYEALLKEKEDKIVFLKKLLENK